MILMLLGLINKYIYSPATDGILRYIFYIGPAFLSLEFLPHPKYAIFGTEVSRKDDILPYLTLKGKLN